MKLRILSDLHNEFHPFDLPVMDDEESQVLVLAGDIHPDGDLSWVKSVAPRFQEVLFVPGNHDYYGLSLFGASEVLTREALKLPNVRILSPGAVPLGGVKVIGATLWTDFERGEPLLLFKARHCMADYHEISSCSPDAVFKVHKRELKFIQRELENANRPCVVITHHAPSERSSHPRYVGSSLNPYFYSNLECFVHTHQPLAWIHGHMHDASDYKLGNTRILCNPRGYWPHEKPEGFNPFLILEIPDAGD